jgi:anhydro-N-acetylmuramic acid kinase
MNAHLARLAAMAQKPTRRIVGLMSGTSLDGLDIALCEVAGQGTQTRVRIEAFATDPYDAAFKAEIRSVFAKRTIDFQQLVLLNAWVGREHALRVNAQLAKWGVPRATVDLVASHGQTVMHVPRSQHGIDRFGNATLQIGDGDHMAVTTGIITLSDFRQKHVAAGGEGAPLAVYGDYYLFAKPGENRILLNMGGIANFTHLPATLAPADVFVTDTGPGNTLIDAAMRKHYQVDYDRDGETAAQGQVHERLLNGLRSHPFFRLPFPKTTGPELFNLEMVTSACQAVHAEDITPPDLLATLTRFSAETIAAAIGEAVEPQGLASYTLFASGGGARNATLMRQLGALLPCAITSTDTLGVPPDAKEAVLFAVLANEAIAGNGDGFGGRPGVPAVTMGKISLPA